MISPTEVISIANQKGGVGKTTTAINTAAALARRGMETLLIDLDPQGNATSGLGFDKKKTLPTIYHALMKDVPIEKTIKPSNIEFLDVVCSNADLIGSEVELVSAFSRENRLKQAISDLKKVYQFIIIDCPPSLGLLTINALTASSKVIIPIQCEYYALEGLANFIDTMNKIKTALNPSLAIEGIVMTMFDARVSLDNQVRSEIEKHFKGNFFKHAIPRNIRLAEAPSFGQPIFQYDPRSKGAEAYAALVNEMLTRRGLRESITERAPTQPMTEFA